MRICRSFHLDLGQFPQRRIFLSPVGEASVSDKSWVAINMAAVFGDLERSHLSGCRLLF